MAGYGVIDFETTGFIPERVDRVVEVAIVSVAPDGSVEDEWTTLVNPHRHMGASDIHGIKAGDVLNAPDFADVADEIIERLAGRTVVAHNALFDMRFLHAELLRADYPILLRPDALCSMKWSGRLVGPAKLEHACEALGIDLVDAHEALGDARATAELLVRLIPVGQRSFEWRVEEERSAVFAWPSPKGRPVVAPVRRGASKVARESWLDALLQRTWIPGQPEDEASYLLVLHRALLDREVSLSEGRQLVEAAEAAGLSGETVARLHRDYLDRMAVEAWADGVLTAEEKTDLAAVAEALRLGDGALEEALTRNERAIRDRSELDTGFLEPGDRIVFTGETESPRERWIERIVAAGLHSGGVTKSTKVVVASDPDSLSGKAEKARRYGIPIVGERFFARMFDEYLARR